MPYRKTWTLYASLARETPAAGLHLMGNTTSFMFEPLQTGGRVTIGRHLKSSILLHDAYASVRHACITRRPDGTWEIADRTSRNGVWVEGKRIDAPTALAAGMRVRIGKTPFIVLNRHRLAPLTACTVGEFCLLLWLVYGSTAEAEERLGKDDVKREFIRTRANKWRNARKTSKASKANGA